MSCLQGRFDEKKYLPALGSEPMSFGSDINSSCLGGKCQGILYTNIKFVNDGGGWNDWRQLKNGECMNS